MAQRKGKTGNPNGRPKGTPNKATKAARELITQLVDKLSPEVEEKLNQLDPKDWLLFYTKLLEFVVPKVAPVQVPDSQEDRPSVVVIP